METIICYVGGNAHGNPGPAAFGVYITDDNNTMMSEIAKRIGNGSDNFATYYAVMVGLQTLQDMLGDTTLVTQIDLRLDNELVKKQLNTEAIINEPGQVPLFVEIHNLRVTSFPYLTLKLISSEENKDVYRLVSEALDAT